MDENEKMRVYRVAASDRKNYIRSVKAYHIVFGNKEQAMHFSPTDAKIMQQVLIKNMGNGFIENI